MKNSQPSLEGQLAVITGGARGIGRATAQALAKEGADIVLIDRDDSGDTATAIEQIGTKVWQYVVDLSIEKQVADVFDEILANHTKIDMLVNNAGFYSTEKKPFWELDFAVWEKMMADNVSTVFLCSRAALPGIRKSASGRIINISSNVVTFGLPNFMHYVAAKSAVVGITRAMAAELGSEGIRVNAIAPGLIDTDTALEVHGQAGLDFVVKGQAIQEQLTAEDIAGSIVNLCGSSARRITGQTLLVNGGATVSGI